MGIQSFRGAGGAGAIGTPRAQKTAFEDSSINAVGTGSATARLDGEQPLKPSGRGWVLSLDVERRLREVRARVSGSPIQPQSLDDADDVALVLACRGGF